MSEQQTRLTLNFWGDNPPVEASEMVEHAEHVAGALGEGYVEGELCGDGFRGWWRRETVEPGTRYAVEPGRWITRDGVPLFAIMLDPERKGWNHFGPADADKMAHKVAALLNADPESR